MSTHTDCTLRVSNQAVWVGLVSWAFLLLVGPARAGHCHGVSLQSTRSSLTASVRSEAATFQTGAGEGSYQGSTLELTASHPVAGLQLGLPVFRLSRAQATTLGLGDVSLRVRVAWVRAAADRVETGVVLAATLPTGDPKRGLGMGHVMLLPGAYGSLRLNDILFGLEVGYARALGEESHAGHSRHPGADVAQPPVDPMTASELQGGVLALARIVERHSIRVGVYGALPYEGDPRLSTFFGPELESGWFTLAAEWHAPLVGEAFSSKVVLEVSARY